MVAVGLVFTRDYLEVARAHREQPPFKTAWTAFERLISDAEVLNSPLTHAICLALRVRLLDQHDSAEQAVSILSELSIADLDREPIEAARQVFGNAQALACLHGLPQVDSHWTRLGDDWLARSEAVAGRLGSAPHERAWLALLRLSSGALFERSDWLEDGASQYRALIGMIHAHGYVPALVEGKDGASLLRTLQMVQAMTLAAEVGLHASIDLWRYEQRGVSVMTGALYPLYYYYYPERWPWEMAVDPRKLTRRARRALAAEEPEESAMLANKSLFARYSSFLELINRQSERPVQAVTLILDELRPIIDLTGGGPVTLTHSVPPAPKRIGWFGRRQS